MVEFIAAILTFTSEVKAQPPAGDVNVAKAYEDVANKNNASFVTEIVFNKQSSELSSDGKSQLEDILKAAKGRGKIDEIKVLAWADGEYPVKGAKGNDARKLADERAQEIKGYIEDNTRNIDLDLHNMAERPYVVQEMLKTSDARVKKSLEQAGLAQPQKSGMPPKSGRALVMVIVQ